MKNRLSILLSAAVAVLAASCVKDQESVFDLSASERINAALENAQHVLQIPENGWLMRYFPHPDQYYGGYAFIVKFTEDEVTAWGEIADDAATSYTSLYKMTRDDGPVLSFDMDNFLLHYFATPSGTMTNRYGDNGMYQGYQGDFEFIIIEAKPESVILKGKRSGCRIVLEPLDRQPADYLTELQQAREDNFRVMDIIYVSAFETEIGGVRYRMEMDRDNRHISFGEKASLERESAAFIYTLDGFRLYEPVEIGGTVFDELAWDLERQVLSGSGVTWEYMMPEGWVSYEDYLGEYDLVYNDNRDWWSEPVTVQVKLERNVDQESFWMTGVNDLYKVKVDYNLSDGNLTIMGQIVGKYGENDVYFAALYASKASNGNPTWTGWRSVKYGIKTKTDVESLENDPDHFVSYFVAGPSAAGKPVNSFGLLMQKPDGTSGGWMSTDTYKDWFIFNDAYYSLFWYSLTKK